ncbi:metal ABC transporter ATP-binding protein [Paracoccus aminophilus]|uniref:Zinc transport system, ATP-binding protein, ZnuC n=1 Tax=Paracoccus aminophilus JCM 7686 TaxID=1367847 RepID=S5YQZ4_PARAH|nr:metal ABC transporter ATP-binding protein [Paracoccus aminophilus]AGT07676.1 zinc transport system, ATP-binding protein, ZnuC [Paracoccus aminophilus JCM 7686]
MTGALISAKGLTVRPPGLGAPVLNEVDFAIQPGEIVTVVGPNGSGKSTFVRALLGYLAPQSGTVTRQSGLRIGYVPQRVHVERTMPMTVQRFLSLPHRVPEDQAAQMLERTGVAGLQSRQLSALSGGQFQRVLLARALLNHPQILVLDEPTQGLDQPGMISFYRLIEEVRAETGAAILMVSHDLLVVMRASDRVICLNGHICCEGTPQDVSSAPAYRALFGAEAQGMLALYQHHHDHEHEHFHDATCGHDHAPGQTHSHTDTHTHPHGLSAVPERQGL